MRPDAPHDDTTRVMVGWLKVRKCAYGPWLEAPCMHCDGSGLDVRACDPEDVPPLCQACGGRGFVWAVDAVHGGQMWAYRAWKGRVLCVLERDPGGDVWDAHLFEGSRTLGVWLQQVGFTGDVVPVTAARETTLDEARRRVAAMSDSELRATADVSLDAIDEFHTLDEAGIRSHQAILTACHERLQQRAAYRARDAAFQHGGVADDYEVAE